MIKKDCHSIDELNSIPASIISRGIVLSILLLIITLIALLCYCLYAFFSPIITVHNLLEFYCSKPYVRELTIGEGCGNQPFFNFKISNYPRLQKLIIEQSSFIYAESVEISDNLMLESIVISDPSSYEDYPFTSVKNPPIFKSKLYQFVIIRSSTINLYVSLCFRLCKWSRYIW